MGLEDLDAAVAEGATERRHSCVTPVSFFVFSAKQTGTETSVQQASLPSSSETPGTPHTLRDSSDLLTSEAAPVPEPLGKEVILGTQQDPPSARRKNFPSKAIQIIDPRPLPPRKTLVSLSEVPNALASPHLYTSVSSDHDYCAPADHFPTGKDSSKVVGSPPIMNDSECKRANPPEEDAASIATSVSEKTAPPADTLPSILHSLDTEPMCRPAADHQVVPCALPSPPARGRDCRRYRRRSPCSDSSSSSYSSSSPSSSSCSPSPKRQIYYFKSQCVGLSFGTCTCIIFLPSCRRRHKHSESSSCSSSPSRSVSQSPPQSYRWSCSRRRCSRSRSRSRSWSSSRSRSPPTNNNLNKWRDVYKSVKDASLSNEVKHSSLFRC